MPSPRVSVVIPTFNRAPLVLETVRNVLSQSLRPHEVIVVDDGSTDGTADLLSDTFGSAITLAKQCNSGPGAARNRGIQMATGDYIQLHDSDDLLSLNKLETQAAILQSTGADMVYGPWLRFSGGPGAITIHGPVLQQAPVPVHRTCLEWFLTDWSTVFQACMLSRSLVTTTGLFREDMWTCDDSDYFVRAFSAAKHIVHEATTLTFYRLDAVNKVTGDGATDARRVSDWMRFVLSTTDLPYLRPSIRRGIARRLLDCTAPHSALCPDDIISRTRAAALLAVPFVRTRARMESFVLRLRDSFRARLLGNRWSPAYRSGALTAYQHRLALQLGFTPDQC